MKNTHRAWSLFAVLLLLSPLAVFAQSRSYFAQGPYQDVEIQVKDLDSDQVIATVQPGGTVTLREGQRVRLIMTADHPGQRGVVYPETEFTEAGIAVSPRRGRWSEPDCAGRKPVRRAAIRSAPRRRRASRHTSSRWSESDGDSSAPFRSRSNRAHR